MSTHITEQLLADMDEARDYDAASSYNYLNAQLKKLSALCVSGKKLHVAARDGSLTIEDDAQFRTWARRRYPHASF